MDFRPVDISKYGFSIIQIETIASCDMRCKFCPYSERNDKGKILPEKTIFELIDSLFAGKNFEYIVLSHLNEPLLDKRIYEFIKYIKSRKLPVIIITNGLSFNSEDVISKLIDANPTYIKVSLQTLNPKLFRETRGINYSFQKYKNGIFEFLKVARTSSSKIIVDIACNFLSGARRAKTLLCGLEHGDPSVYNAIDDLRTDVKSFLNELQDYNEYFNFKNKDIDRYLDKVKIDYLNQEGFQIGTNILLKVKPFIYWRKLTEFYPIKNVKGCSTRILGILASGAVVPCCLAYDDMLCLGNVKEDSLYTILERNADLINNIRKGKNLSLVCQRCLGAPTKRGIILRQARNKIFNIRSV